MTSDPKSADNAESDIVHISCKPEGWNTWHTDAYKTEHHSHFISPTSSYWTFPEGGGANLCE